MQVEELETKLKEVTRKLEESEEIIKVYHKEVEALMRQLQRTAKNITILSARLRDHNLDCTIHPNEKVLLGEQNQTQDQ